MKYIKAHKGSAVLILIVIILAAVYIGISIYFSSHFFSNTTVNGEDASFMTAKEVDQILRNAADSYVLTITDRDGNSYELIGADFGYSYTLSNSSKTLLKEQSGFAWPMQISQQHELTLDVSASYEETDAKNAISKLALFDTDSYIAPQDAALTQTEDGWVITEEVMGTTLLDSARQKVLDCLNDGTTTLELTDEDYENPTVYSNDESLNTTLSQISKYTDTTITYTLKSSDENLVIDSSIIQSLLSIADDGSVSISEEAVTDYVQSLASTYNTYGDEREFKTTLGDTITIGGGDYGWVVDKEAMVKQLLEDLNTGGSITGEMQYSQEATYEGSQEIQDTYVEIDYSNQHLYYYKEGKLIVETDIVSGNISKGNGSPDGIFKIVYKQSPATLVGEDYSSDVTYFMPFAYNVGIHDASWRSSFGGSIYKTSGSHGCINVPASAAKKIYKNIETGTPVIAFYRDTVKLTSENAKVSNAYSYVSED
ncbi:L,D-transpeptidase family protein [Eubacterium oxidoreducens]|uniref:Putative peptidoglycan binding domain-containing protein n=1 Tax=Eubacterium oxidoreducens TaxID=1732 RepID=A0A1G5ZZS3_EUBOX|nr:L,D-transpeptidase family protein [Eubacterium oxidoreducens]SDB01704.1 Putative peptidoglycan binding domain-containing protein [Eubacterium oxidoreducens]